MKFIILFMILLLVGCSTNAEIIDETEEYSPSCAMGLTEDHAPGACGLYTDQDENQICDHSE